MTWTPMDLDEAKRTLDAFFEQPKGSMDAAGWVRAVEARMVERGASPDEIEAKLEEIRGVATPEAHPELRAAPGDRLVVQAHHQGEPERDGEILEVHDEDGGPPFLVRWEDGTTTMLYPSSDVAIQHFPRGE